MPKGFFTMRIRVMTKQDIPAGLRLNTLSDGNQTSADWERFLVSSPRGCFVMEDGNKVVGTAATMVTRIDLHGLVWFWWIRSTASKELELTPEQNNRASRSRKHFHKSTVMYSTRVTSISWIVGNVCVIEMLDCFVQELSSISLLAVLADPPKHTNPCKSISRNQS